jgi:hypothetical protein
MAQLGITEGPVTLISTAKNLAGAWADLGGEIAVNGFNMIGLWLNVDINSSLDVRVRCLLKHTAAHADEFVLPILSTTSSVINVDDEYLELTNDADQTILLSWALDCVAPFVQFQVMAGTVGVTPGQIDDARITKGSK